MPIRLAAAALLGLEAFGILALAGWQVVALIGGDTDSVASSIALIVLTVIGAAIVGAFASERRATPPPRVQAAS